MSFQAVAWAWQAKIPNAGCKLILMGLAQYAHEDGYCFPSQKTIAQLCSMTDRSVRTHLQWLEDNGFLTRQSRFLANGNPTSDGITLILSKTFDATEPVKLKDENRPAENISSGKKSARPAETISANTVSEYLDIYLEYARVWGKENGMTEAFIEANITYFVDYLKSANKKYKDYEAALRNCLRKNWAGYRLPKQESKNDRQRSFMQDIMQDRGERVERDITPAT